MAQSFQNPSFETPGTDTGFAMDWGVTIVNSLVEFSSFLRGDAVGIISVFDAVIPAGVSVIDNEDGTLTLINALGATEAVESFSFGWAGNQFFLFAIPPGFLDPMLFSLAKTKENFEDGFGVDENFVLDVDATTTVLPIKDVELIVNNFVNARLEIAGVKLTVVSNTVDSFTVTPALATPPFANSTLRVVRGPVNDEGFLSSFTSLAGNDPVLETFNGGWPAGSPVAFKAAFDSNITLGSLASNIFADGSAFPLGDFANDVRFIVFQIDSDRTPNSLLMSFRNEFGSLVNSHPISFTVPAGVTIPPEGIEVPFAATNFTGLRDLVGMAEGSTPHNRFTMVGNPGLDLERADF